jgi:GNAT superfamily N-acetyltransferase
MSPKIMLGDRLTPELLKQIADRLMAFNLSQVPQRPRPLLLLLSPPDSDEIVGGVYAETWLTHLHGHLLFVPEEMRGMGVGQKLVMEAEAEAIRRGCRTSVLDTYSFQARGFYERLGYSVFATLDDYPDGMSRFYMKKQLGSP